MWLAHGHNLWHSVRWAASRTTEAAVSRRQKDPLRDLTAHERRELARISRSQATPAVEVIRARLLLAVASGDDYQTAALSVGRRSGDAVSRLVARFNAEG